MLIGACDPMLCPNWGFRLGALLNVCETPVAADPLDCVTTGSYHTLQDTTGCLGNTTAAINRMLHEYEGPTGALGSLECSVGGFFKVRQLRHHFRPFPTQLQAR